MVSARRGEATSCQTEDPSYVKVAEGYAGTKLHKRGIKVRERLAIMRANCGTARPTTMAQTRASQRGMRELGVKRV